MRVAKRGMRGPYSVNNSAVTGNNVRQGWQQLAGVPGGIGVARQMRVVIKQPKHDHQHGIKASDLRHKP